MEHKELKTYKCSECGLSYTDKDLAKKCEEWCRKYHTCNVEIMKHSVEQKTYGRN